MGLAQRMCLHIAYDLDRHIQSLAQTRPKLNPTPAGHDRVSIGDCPRLGIDHASRTQAYAEHPELRFSSSAARIAPSMRAYTASPPSWAHVGTSALYTTWGGRPKRDTQGWHWRSWYHRYRRNTRSGVQETCSTSQYTYRPRALQRARGRTLPNLTAGRWQRGPRGSPPRSCPRVP